MKVIFLDIDGVVCLHKDKKNWDNDEEVFDAECCNRLKEIMQATESKLVLSSSWRLFPESIEYVFSQFEPHGITRRDFIGITPLLGSAARRFYSIWRAIATWILSSRSTMKCIIAKIFRMPV